MSKPDTTKATPRPWRMPEGQDGRHLATGILAPWQSNESEPYHPLIVTSISGSGNAPLEVARANAALIVQAVNSYEALKAVAEAATRHANARCGGDWTLWYARYLHDPLADCELMLLCVTLAALESIRKPSP